MRSGFIGIARTQLIIVTRRLTGRLVRTVHRSEPPRAVTLVALDIVGFGRRSSGQQAHIRRRLFAAADLIKQKLSGRLAYGVLDRGDGVLVVLPTSVDSLHLLGEVLPEVAESIDAGNHGSDTMILRCVIHKGRAERDRWGWVGRDVNLVFRLLDSPALRQLRRAADPRSPLTVAFSQAVYRDACDRLDDQQALANTIKERWHDSLERHLFRVKDFRRLAWVASVGAPSH